MMCILNACWLLCETLGSDNLAIHKHNWPTRNLIRAEKIACRVIEDRLILEGEWECASVDLRKRVRVHELEEGWPRIGTKNVYLVAGALIEPSLQSSQENADARGDASFCNE
jgi:hypothetical protein